MEGVSRTHETSRKLGNLLPILVYLRVMQRAGSVKDGEWSKEASDRNVMTFFLRFPGILDLGFLCCFARKGLRLVPQ